MKVLNLVKDQSSVQEQGNCSAYVVSISENQYVLRLDAHTSENISIRAKKAASCFMSPGVGDKVLLFIDVDESYILAVLESAAADTMYVKLDGSLVLESTAEVTIASDRINLVSRDSCSIVNDRLNLVSDSANLTLGDVNLDSRSATSSVNHNKFYAETTETVADTSTQRFRNSYRFVECMEQLKAGNLMQSVKSLFASRSRQAIIQADQDVKIDGERIHMG